MFKKMFCPSPNIPRSKHSEATCHKNMASLADDFWSIYNKEWREARQNMRSVKHDEEIIYLLMRIIRGIYDFCQDEVNKPHSKHKRTEEELTEEYIQHKLPTAFHKDHVTNPIRSFIHRCIHCLYRMCAMKQSAPYILWTPKGDIIDREKFVIEGGKDEHVCDWTVWPAVINENGAVLKKGVIIPV